jgi:hypothetical protein
MGRQFKPGQLQTGSLYNISASYAVTASYAANGGGTSINTGSFVTTSSFNAFTASYTTGSFTGSFIGNGSQLTGIVSSKWTGSNPISRQSDVEITGSLRVQGSITGSLFGTASWSTNAVTASYVQTAQTASYVLQAVSSSFATSALTASYVLPLKQEVQLTGSLNISGSTTQIGTNNLLGQTNLSGSIYVSGSMNALADLTLAGTLRLDPAQDPGNTNATASFLFTSASNTEQGYDLYYRQDGNLVKFKWLEGGISSGLLYGGKITSSGSIIYVSSGSGVILDPNATFTKEINPQFTYVTWANYSASATYLTSSQNTYIYVDSVGTIHQQTNFFDQTQYEQAIPLGRVTHPNYSSITGIGSNVQTTYDSDSQQSAFVRAFGPLKVSGFSIQAHPGSLSFGVGSGTAFTLGGFYSQDPNSPSHYNGAATPTASIARAYRSGSGIRLDNNGGAFYTTIDPDYWDDGTGVLNTMASGDWQIQRVFFNTVSGRSTVYYGQNTYTTLLNALQYLTTDSFTEGEFTANSLIFIGYLVLKGQTNNIADTNNNRVINGGIFRNIAGGSSGAGAVAQNLDDLSDVTITTPSNGQALVYNSGTWENGTPSLASTASYVLLAVSSSFATSASFAPSTPAFPFTGSARITGSLGVTGSTSFMTTGSGVASPFTFTAGGTATSPYVKVVNSDAVSEVSLVATRLAGTGVLSTAVNRAFLYLSNAAGYHNVIGSNDGLAFTAFSPAGYDPAADQMRLKNGNLGIGTAYSATARLDVKAPGALSTDLAFRVRNSADDRNLFSILGNGDIEVRTNRVSLSQSTRLSIGGSNTDNGLDASGYTENTIVGFNNTNTGRRGTVIGSSNTIVNAGTNASTTIGYGNSNRENGVVVGHSNTLGGIVLGTNNIGGGVGRTAVIGDSNSVSVANGNPGQPMFLLGNGVTLPNLSAINNCVFLSAGANSTDPFVTIKNDNLSIGSLTPWTTNFDNSSRGVFYTRVGIAPTTMAAGTIAMYAASSSVNNARPTFRTENGTVVWLGDESRLFNVTASRTIISSSQNTVSGSSLTVYGSGSAQPVFTVQGSQGELFSITDNLSGSLFSVNDISGLPILEVFSDNTTLIGNYQDPMLITTAKVVQTNSGSFTLYSLPTASYDTAFFEYSVRSGSNARAGTIMAIQSGSAVNFTETTTTDFGNTTAVAFTVIVTGSNMALTGSSTTGAWTIKTIVRGL